MSDEVPRRGSLPLDVDRVVVEEGVITRAVKWIKRWFLSEKHRLPQRDAYGKTGYSIASITTALDSEPIQDLEPLLLQSYQGALPEAHAALARWEPRHDAGRYLAAALASYRARPVESLLKDVAGAAVLGLGAYLGAHLPDFDIPMLGIGAHRNFLFHSAVPVWALYRLHTWTVYKLRPTQDSVVDLCCKAAGLFVGGFALGACVHLFVDAVFQGDKAVIFGALGSLVDGTLVDDRLWLGGSALVCLYVAYRELEYVLGKDHIIISVCRTYLEKARSAADGIYDWTGKLVKRFAGMMGETRATFASQFLHGGR